MGKDLQIFANEDFGTIRTVGTPDNPLFCLADVCKALELPQVAKVVQRLDREVLSTHPLQTAGGIQEMYFVNEDGLYDVILDSRKPEAKKFRKWITSEVLPSIRKTGAYSLPQQKSVEVKPSDMVMEIGAMSNAIVSTFNGVMKGIALAQATDIISNYYNFDLTALKDLIPPAEHEIGYMNATQVGKKINQSPYEVNKLLKEKGLQVKEGKVWRLTDEGKKYGELMPFNNHGHSDYQIRWTPRVLPVLLERTIH